MNFLEVVLFHLNSGKHLLVRRTGGDRLKRLISFIVGLLVFVGLGSLLFMAIEHQKLTDYQQTLWQYNWFAPTLYTIAGVVILIALIFLFFSFTTSYKKRGIYEKFEDGDVYINKRTIENNVQHTLAKYDDVRQPKVLVKLHQKKRDAYMDIFVDLLVARQDRQALLERLHQDIKANVEAFAEMPVKQLKLQVLDQKELKRRVI